jgi:predicted ester cyclase
MSDGPDDLRSIYERYIARCSEHRVEELAEFVASDVNGPDEGLERYAAGLRAVIDAFPDYRWEIEDLVVDGDLLAARLTAAGTQTGAFRGIAATGRRIETQELAMYRITDGRIARCWGDLGSVVRDAIVSGG